MGAEQHVDMRMAGGRLEAVGRELDQQAERVLEVDRVHEAAVLDAAVADAALVEALDGLAERRVRQRSVSARARRMARRSATSRALLRLTGSASPSRSG